MRPVFQNILAKIGHGPRAAARVCLWAIISAVLLVPSVPSALAQDESGAGAGVPVGEVRIELEKFGVGNIARRGDWAGIRIRIMDAAPKQRELIVRLTGFDADGDTPLYDRVVTANPGVWQGVWLYAWVPFSYEPGNGMRVSIYEAEEGTGETAEIGATGYNAGRLLSSMVLNPVGGSVRSASEGMIAMIGQRALGLRHYSLRNPTGGGEVWHVRGHELTEVALGITPADMPDRKTGLIPFDAIVWSQGDPSELRGERARAVRDWVESGGHLIIIMPPVGQTWTNPTSNELHDIMPAVAVSRQENVDLTPYRPMLTADKGGRFPKTGIVHRFKPLAEAYPHEAMRVLNGPDGECVVARRLVGCGAVTLIGLDLNQTAFSQFEMIDGDVFWHRVLGRRGKLIDESDKQANQAFLFSNRKPWHYDRDIPGLIAKTGRSAAGVLAGFVVFVLYWLIAGPLGFAVLKHRKLAQHAWLAFVLAAAAFTGVSWGGATVLRPGKVEATHLTLLDHVYGQPMQRARMWASVLIPRYGTARISVGDPEDGESQAVGHRSLNAITAWQSPDSESGGLAGFPDARGYVVDTRDPDSMVVPTRSTVKQIQADWVGGPRWDMIRPTGVLGEGNGEITLQTSSDATRRLPVLNGWVKHGLPGSLRNVAFFVVRRQTTLRAPSNELICAANAYILSEWKPGEPVDLSVVTGKTGRETLASAYLDGFVPRLTWSDQVDQNDMSPYSTRLMALTFMPHLPPPTAGTDGTAMYAALRSSTHGWDLGRWFTQPCLMIVGELGDGVESPVPLAVDGELVPTSGRTMVRWVYPLPDNPPEVGTKDGQVPESEPEPAAPEPEAGPATLDFTGGGRGGGGGY